MRMLAEDELREAVLLIFANKQVCIFMIYLSTIPINLSMSRPYKHPQLIIDRTYDTLLFSNVIKKNLITSLSSHPNQIYFEMNSINDARKIFIMSVLT